MKLEQSQSQRLNQQQMQNIELLQMSTMELEASIQELALNNPLVEPEDTLFPAAEERRSSEILDKLRWLEETDHQNHFYQSVEKEELNPMLWASTEGGLEETLFRFISRQLYPLDLPESDEQAVRYLAACLDDDGYLRISLEELAGSSGFCLEQLQHCLEILCSLEPAGIGAKDLSQCLTIQLKRIHYEGPALDIVQNHLEQLAKRHYKAIATDLNITIPAVQAAERTIRELDPRPGAVFQRPEQPPYILPDIFVDEADGQFQLRTRRGERPPFHINKYYVDLLEQTDDREVREYLTEKLHQAEDVLYAVNQRENTLLSCAKAILNFQKAFFEEGPQALLPLRMMDVAQELGIHESTVSRAVREKYIQCKQGVYPLSYFFSRPATGEKLTELGGSAARSLMQKLIREEDKEHPLSDQKLSELMAEMACPISRRTVTKYREALSIPTASARKQR